MIQILTYDDLPWRDDFDYESGYPSEQARWAAVPRRDEFIHVLLQHDVDTRPERTLQVLQHEERLQLPSNVMIFNKRIDRQHLRKRGELRYTDYPLDFTYLQHLQDQQRFVIGYHSNSFERGLWNVDRALEIFEQDVAELRTTFRINYFSPHGGTPSPHDGRNNSDVPIPQSLRSSLRWVSNKHGPRLISFSDGGINSPKRDPNLRDLRDFVATWKRGERYRVLTHPQYYNDPFGPSPRMLEAEWYRKVLDTYGRGESGWTNVQIQNS
ncbi:MAG TPA: hypothetical protein VJ837_00015 [Candidatus Paceibacterota bacterium]|nr:hypothetical protein [Candidatus Paceibacterota bacterium]